VRRAGPAAASARLVRALAHEIGNLLAGVRLLVHVGAAGGAGARGGDAADAGRVDALLAHAGHLLGPIGALLGRGAGARGRLAARDVLSALARAADGAVDVAAADDELPDLVADPDALHHALLGLVQSPPGGASRRPQVSAVRARGGVAFRVALGAPVPRPSRRDRPSGGLPSGIELAVAVAEALVRRDGGRLRRGPARGGAGEVCLVLPAAPAARAAARPPGAPAPARPGRRPTSAARAGPRRARASRGPSARSR